jgi:hypothetical protein
VINLFELFSSLWSASGRACSAGLESVA